MQEVTGQSLATALTDHSRSQSPLQQQSSVQGSAERLHCIARYSLSPDYMSMSSNVKFQLLLQVDSSTQVKIYHSLLSTPKPCEEGELDLESWPASS